MNMLEIIQKFLNNKEACTEVLMNPVLGVWAGFAKMSKFIEGKWLGFFITVELSPIIYNKA